MILSLFFLLGALGLGMFISAAARSQLLATQIALIVTFLPTILLSGFMFPVRSMPKIFQWLTYLNPLRHYLEIIRGIFLKGVGLEALWFQHAALLALGFVLMAMAVARFQKHVA